MKNKILIMPILSQYNAANRFIKDIEEALSEKGFCTISADKADDIALDDILFFLCFNGVVFDHTDLCRHLEYHSIPIISIFLDKPETHYTRILKSTSNSILTFPDKNHIRYFMKYMEFNNISKFLPHGGSVSEKFSKDIPFEDRTIDILFSGSRFSEDMAKNNFIKLYGKDDTISNISDYLKTDYNINFEKYLDETLIQNGKIRKTADYRNVFIKYSHAYEIYRGYYRDETIKTLLESGLDVVCYGNGWGDSEFIKFKNFKYMGDCDFEESLDLITNAKITLNIMPTFKNGSHDRIFSAMLNGSVCLSTKTTMLDSLIKHNENILFYDLNAKGQLIKDIGTILNSKNEFNRITSDALKTSQDNFLWRHRVGDILEMVKE